MRKTRSALIFLAVAILITGCEDAAPPKAEPAGQVGQPGSAGATPGEEPAEPSKSAEPLRFKIDESQSQVSVEQGNKVQFPVASGGVTPYAYSMSNAQIGVIDSATGKVEITGSEGQHSTTYSVTDADDNTQTIIIIVVIRIERPEGSVSITVPSFLVGTDWGGMYEGQYLPRQGVRWKFEALNVYSSTVGYSAGFRHPEWIVSDSTVGNRYVITRTLPGVTRLTYSFTKRDDRTLLYEYESTPGGGREAERAIMKECGTPTSEEQSISVPQKFHGTFSASYTSYGESVPYDVVTVVVTSDNITSTHSSEERSSLNFNMQEHIRDKGHRVESEEAVLSSSNDHSFGSSGVSIWGKDAIFLTFTDCHVHENPFAMAIDGTTLWIGSGRYEKQS